MNVCSIFSRLGSHSLRNLRRNALGLDYGNQFKIFLIKCTKCIYSVRLHLHSPFFSLSEAKYGNKLITLYNEQYLVPSFYNLCLDSIQNAALKIASFFFPCKRSIIILQENFLNHRMFLNNSNRYLKTLNYLSDVPSNFYC